MTSTDRLTGLSTSVAVKPPVKAVTIANITLSGEQTIDGVAVVAGDRVLVKEQTDAVENGIYVVATTAWARAEDFDGSRDVVKGTLVVSNAGTSIYYRVTTEDPIVIGTSLIAFEVVSGAISQSSIGAALYPQSDAEAAILIDPPNKHIYYGFVDRYGTITGSGGADTAIVQAAIDQSRQATADAAFAVIPRGVTCSVQTSGSTTTPVGTALTLAANSRLRIDGVLISTENCHILEATGDDVLCICDGTIQGYGTFFVTGASNGALFKNNGGNNCRFIGTGKLISPPQYAIWYRGGSATGGRIGKFKILGGPTSLGGNSEHYGVLIDGLFTGLEIDSFTTEVSGGGAVGQGLSSASSLARPDGVLIGNPIFRGCLDHGVYFFGNYCTFGNINQIDCESTARFGGIGNTVGSVITSNSGGGNGGADFQTWSKGSVGPITCTDYRSVGFSLQPRFGEAADDCISYNTFGPITLIGAPADTDVRTAFRIRGVESSGSTETSYSDISVGPIVIKDASQSVTAEGAIQINVGTGKTASRVKLTSATIDTCGYQGLEISSAGTFIDCDFDNITVRNPGSAASASGSTTHGFRVSSPITLEDCSLSNLYAHDDRGGSATMASGFSTNATLTRCKALNNRSLGHVTSVGNFGTGADHGTTRGATSVADGGTVTHGHPITPTSVRVTPSTTGEFVSVTAISSTTFTVAIKKHDNSAGTTQVVYWEVSG